VLRIHFIRAHNGSRLACRFVAIGSGYDPNARTGRKIEAEA
jgi:hypothetical protein